MKQHTFVWSRVARHFARAALTVAILSNGLALKEAQAQSSAPEADPASDDQKVAAPLQNTGATQGSAATAPATAAAPATATAAATTTAAVAEVPPTSSGYRLGAHAEVDLGTLIALKQGAGLAAGVVYGPFRAGLSYATFLSNKSFGGTPDGFTMRANYILGINASYFIAQDTDEGFYVQGMFHIKQQGVTNNATGDHKDLNSLALGLELGYVWKVYKGLYVCPRVGALYYVKPPQDNNRPVTIGDRDYNNSRHKTFDTYYIPTLSLGYSWQ